MILAPIVWMDKIKYEHKRRTAHIGRLKGKLREGRLIWFRNVTRREEDN